ncbi:thioesterase family protein [Pontixanthobacter gangjinensis]|uniref:Acyl-CoA thioesterase n=1 Tax=Pontixanthobacter gangjinensis TaxID=1028742 RepID=A0A6I4SIB9_9SPHN|nr:thioesterase family protein [Pontixanthobacter gangjinensis]MXO55551.1 acyl-CoA thioesterase [Pontixanthobacter gangjinensis]
MSNPFLHKFRVRYSELDPQGVVFNARYLEYADIIVTEYWRDRRIRMFGDGALEFHVAHADVAFRKPIRADEWIEGRAWTTRFGNSSMTTRIELHGAVADSAADDRDDLRAEIELVNVHVDLASGRPLPIPASVREALSK